MYTYIQYYQIMILPPYSRMQINLLINQCLSHLNSYFCKINEAYRWWCGARLLQGYCARIVENSLRGRGGMEEYSLKIYLTKGLLKAFTGKI